jgi:hypothetical protein
MALLWLGTLGEEAADMDDLRAPRSSRQMASRHGCLTRAGRIRPGPRLASRGPFGNLRHFRAGRESAA